MSQRITQVDAFTDRPFAGNPAAVCIMPGPSDERWMRDVAREMNLSETAFLHREGDGYRLRWFTPAVEVDLCGHATLAAAHVLWEEGHLDPADPAVFQTRSGRLTAVRRGAAIELDFPSQPPARIDPPHGLAEALGAPIRWAGQNGMDLLVELDSDVVVGSLRPDLGRLAEVPVRGVIVTAESDQSFDFDRTFDFVSRFFAPRVGINEDPVTGSAHCALGPFWGERLGKTELVGLQVSERRGIVGVRLEGDRVILGGRAVTVLKGELFA
jgi:PhzF family phenazine biosynthesis protein